MKGITLFSWRPGQLRSWRAGSWTWEEEGEKEGSQWLGPTFQTLVQAASSSYAQPAQLDLQSGLVKRKEWPPVFVEEKRLSHIRLFRAHGATRLLCPWDLLGKNTRVGYHFPLQGIFQTQRWNPGPLRWRPSPSLQADSLPIDSSGKPLLSRNLWVKQFCYYLKILFWIFWIP